MIHASPLARIESGAGEVRRDPRSSMTSLHLISQARLKDAQLLTTELVANAVHHGGAAGSRIVLTVRATEHLLRVEVSDRGAGFDPGRVSVPTRREAGGGWGLPIVATVADRWGVERDQSTRAWSEIDRPARDSPLTAGTPAEPDPS
jgi:anti-sigma regulatory factor (Ser/Thr protein kinase)